MDNQRKRRSYVDRTRLQSTKYCTGSHQYSDFLEDKEDGEQVKWNGWEQQAASQEEAKDNLYQQRLHYWASQGPMPKQCCPRMRVEPTKAKPKRNKKQSWRFNES
jgi:hypothetical protein